MVHEQCMSMHSLVEETQTLKISFAEQTSTRGQCRGSYRGRRRGETDRVLIKPL